MTAQKKDVQINSESKNRNANNGWIEVKRNKENNRPADKSEPTTRNIKSESTKKTNKFGMLEEPLAEKAPKQKPAQKVAPTKSKSASPPKQKAAPKPSKVEEAPKAKKSQEPKVSSPKPKTAAVPVKSEKSEKVDKRPKSSPTAKPSKVIAPKDKKKTEAKGKRRSSVADLCKQLFRWFSFALIAICVLGLVTVAYQQHRRIVDDLTKYHALEITAMKISFGQEAKKCEEVNGKNVAILSEVREELQSMKDQREKDLADQRERDIENQEKFKGKLKDLEKLKQQTEALKPVVAAMKDKDHFAETLDDLKKLTTN